MSIKTREFTLNDLEFSDVINGLNKHFAEPEPRPGFVEVNVYDGNAIFYRFDAEMWLDKLIAWLRTEHGIFYYPGMEAKYAKTDKILPFTDRMRDEGAFNSLRRLHKIVTGVEAETDSPTLIASAIANDVAVLRNDLKNALEAKESFFESKGRHDYKRGLMDYIRQESVQNGYNLPEEVDGEPLTIERVFHDLLDLMRMRGDELRILESKCSRLNEIVEELNALNNEIKEES